MHSRSVGSQDSFPLAFPRIRTGLIVLLLGGLGGLIFAASILGVSRPIEPPCTACYIGAFRPPLEPYGHPIRPDARAATGPAPSPAHAETGTVAREARMDGGLARITANQMTALIQPVQGGSIEPIDDLERQANPGPFDLQRFQGVEPADLGTVSDAPERSWRARPVRDVPTWSIPAWGIPGRRPEASPATGGAEEEWTDLPGADLTAYRGWGRDGRHLTGLMPIAVTAWTNGFAPHWRVAMQHDLERHFPRIGTVGLNPGQPATVPGGFVAITDGKAPPAINFVSTTDDQPTHGPSLPLGAGFSLLGLDGMSSSDPARGATPYRFAVAVTPAIAYFPVSGPSDDVQYFWPDVRPSSTGVSAGLAYTPWEQPTAGLPFLNLRFAARYAANKEFSGVVRGAGGGNTLVLSLWGALHF
jgi:hypothetical protein